MTTQTRIEITPADHGIIAATLDCCTRLGDDETYDELAAALKYEQVAGSDDLNGLISYAVVHSFKRHLPANLTFIKV